jgi:1,4-dihydroxy-2-naphthoate octaprenyltransferase
MDNTKQIPVQAWIAAARLRTLPLAMAAIGMGNLLHLGGPAFRPEVMVLAMVCTVFLQILSNFANDLGDSEHGADNQERKGPARMVQSGVIGKQSMRKAVVILAIASFISGTFLLWIAFRGNWQAAIPLFAAGLCSIAAAWFYTNGARPYGYLALGDIAVFLFFGLLAVLGSSWLQVQEFSFQHLLPAVSAGLWSTAVLNLNNMRDLSSDSLAGKRTVPMLLGERGASLYHLFLVSGGILSLFVYAIMNQAIWVAGSIPGILLMLRTLPVVFSERDVPSLDRQLKPQALGTFAAVAGMFLCRLFF